MMGSQFRSTSSSGHVSVRAGFTGDNDRFEKIAHGRNPIPALVEMIRDYPRDALEFFGQSLYGKLSSSDRATVIDTRVLRACAMKCRNTISTVRCVWSAPMAVSIWC